MLVVYRILQWPVAFASVIAPRDQHSHHKTREDSKRKTDVFPLLPNVWDNVERVTKLNKGRLLKKILSLFIALYITICLSMIITIDSS